MANFGCNEELLNLLNVYRDKEYVKNNFVYWLHLYPDILNVMFIDNYRELFDETIKMYMPDVLRKIIEKDKFDCIYMLAKNYEKELFQNIDIILDETPNFKDYFCNLVGFQSFEICALEKQEKILKKALDFKEFNFPTDYTSNLLFLLSALPFFDDKFTEAHKGKIEKFLTFHFNTIDPQIYDEDLLFLFETIRLSSANHAFINDYFVNNLEFIALIFANKKLITLKRENILDFYVELIKDVMRIENATVKDMKLKKGAFSRTLIINNKVLKSGHKNTKEIPYHKRILQPAVRQNIKYFNNRLDFDLDFVEMYERVGDLGIDNEHKAYEVFKEMLKDDVIMGDPSPENFGILLKPNIPYHEPTGYKDDEFHIDNETVGIYDSQCSKEILDKGEVVVRDVDCIYYFKGVHESIKHKVKCGLKVDLYHFGEIGLGTSQFGPRFELYLDKYCKDVETEIENKNNPSFKK